MDAPELTDAAKAASRAFAAFGMFLSDELEPQGRDKEGVGRIASRVDHAMQAYDVARFERFDVFFGEWRFEVDRFFRAHSSAEAVRWEWQSRLTATGKAAMWVGKLSTWTARAVTVPP